MARRVRFTCAALLLQMMRCDVTKFNKRFGICKVRLPCGALVHVAQPLRPPLPAHTHSHQPGTELPSPPPLQMSAKAYVGEDVVCEAELTLVMGK